MEQSKRCTGCKQVLPLSAFGAKVSGRNGLNSACKGCIGVRLHQYYERNRAAMLAYQQRWRAANRERVRANQQRWRAENRQGELERSRRYYEANRERLKAAQRERGPRNYRQNQAAHYARKRAWLRAHPGRDAEYARRRRALKLATAVAEISPDLLAGKLAYWGHRCWMCGGEPETWDHVKPLSKGGPHMLANLRPACVSCNSTKNAKWRGASAALSHRSPGATLVGGRRVRGLAGSADRTGPAGIHLQP